MAGGRTTGGRRRKSPWTGRPRGADARHLDDGPLLVYGVNPVLELLRSAEPITRVWTARCPRERELVAAAAARGLELIPSERATLEHLVRTPHHQGVVAETPAFGYVPLERLLGPECPSALVLDGIQDPRNLGAILRTARALGVGGVVLGRDRCVGVTPVVVAASAGGVFGLPLARVTNLVRAMEALKEAGFWLVGLVPHGGTELRKLAAPSRPALVAGGEGEGLRSLVHRTCDFAVSIPMAPGVESLNVGVAVGIALFELVGRSART
jgi:23S rRNA (guanosine2251-2'-O)-methyltransferase